MKLLYYGGNGYEGLKEVGKYDVNYDDETGSKEKSFTSLSKAREFFDSIQNEKAFWDLSSGLPELIDGYIVDFNE